jgi:hypothetical protein
MCDEKPDNAVRVKNGSPSRRPAAGAGGAVESTRLRLAGQGGEDESRRPPEVNSALESERTSLASDE